MKKALSILQKIDSYIIATAFIVMTLASFAQVINRNFIGAGVSWFEELARYCMIYMALLAAEMGLRDGTQISITAVTDLLGKKTQAVLVILTKIIMIVFSVIVFSTSLQILAKQIAFGQNSSGLGVPMYVPYFALPLAFAIISIVQTATVICLISAFFSGGNDHTSEGAAS